MNLAVFDDATIKFLPVSYTRSVGDIRCGILKLRQRLQALLFGEQDSIIIDLQLVPLYKERHPDWMVNQISGDTLIVNSRLKCSPDSIKSIKDLKPGESLVLEDGTIVALRLDLQQTELAYESIRELLKKTEKISCKAGLYHNMADIIMDNGRMLEFDYEQFFHDAENFIETEPGVTLLNPYQVFIGENAVLKPGVVIDATHGPVVIDENAEVMSHSVITGPAYIGKGSIVKVGAKIYGNTSIGPVCKVGGEIEGSIIQAYSNKQHDGFLGHAYVGEWVNIGAGTNNSDLKNNYKPVSLYSYYDNAKINSGYQFLGSVMADHVKTGINCTLNTGVVIGTGCNLWGSKLFSDYVRSFSWGEADNLIPYNFEAFIETARTVKLRRKLDWSDTETDLFRAIWNIKN